MASVSLQPSKIEIGLSPFETWGSGPKNFLNQYFKEYRLSPFGAYKSVLTTLEKFGVQAALWTLKHSAVTDPLDFTEMHYSCGAPTLIGDDSNSSTHSSRFICAEWKYSIIQLFVNKSDSSDIPLEVLQRIGFYKVPPREIELNPSFTESITYLGKDNKSFDPSQEFHLAPIELFKNKYGIEAAKQVVKESKKHFKTATYKEEIIRKLGEGEREWVEEQFSDRCTIL